MISYTFIAPPLVCVRWYPRL